LVNTKISFKTKRKFYLKKESLLFPYFQVLFQVI
jgi:hypothetical protein